MPGVGEEHIDGEVEAQGRRREPRWENPQGLIGTWEQDKGGKGETDGCGKRRQTQACNAGKIVKRQRLEGGRCGEHPVRQRFAPGEEVGSR